MRDRAPPDDIVTAKLVGRVLHVDLGADPPAAEPAAPARSPVTLLARLARYQQEHPRGLERRCRANRTRRPSSCGSRMHAQDLKRVSDQAARPRRYSMLPGRSRISLSRMSIAAD